MLGWMIDLGVADLQLAIIILFAFLAFFIAIYLTTIMVRHENYENRIQQLRLKREKSLTQSSDLKNPDSLLDINSVRGKLKKFGTFGSNNRVGELLIAKEDEFFLRLGNFDDYEIAKALFCISRLGLSILIPIFMVLSLGSLITLGSQLVTYSVLIFLGFALGWMMPKWILVNMVNQRKAEVNDELPLMLDLLRLLQGVGLSIEQSLQIIARDFKVVLPVLGSEIAISLEKYARGMTREQSMDRMITGLSNDELTAICRLIAQIDRYGGASREPLNRFGVKLRDQRRSGMKDKIGKLTVKMTGVMVLTLLPALMIVTAGSGFIAVFRGLSSMSGG